MNAETEDPGLSILIKIITLVFIFYGYYINVMYLFDNTGKLDPVEEFFRWVGVFFPPAGALFGYLLT